MSVSKRKVQAERQELDKLAKRKPYSYESPHAVRAVDNIARSICTATCAFRGLTPCWSVHTDRADAMEWPNPFCNEPGCHALAEEVYRDSGKLR